MQKLLPDLAGRAVLVLLLLFLAYQAARAYVADEASALLFHLGLFCVTATLLASPRGQLLPPRKATLASVHKEIVGGTIVRMTRTQKCLSLLGFVLLAVAAYLQLM